ncbi:MAG TPA: hypothetical protein VHH88_08925 [Verrucomicrobiae bacterium]|nr:hypothetical protein [Verrucomicrobiae bacterium]
MTAWVTLAAVSFHEIAINTLLGLIAAACIGFTIYKSEKPLVMGVRWVSTALLLWYLLKEMPPLIGVLLSPCFIVIWRRPLVSIVARPFENLFTGGSEPPVPQPLYSAAQGKLKKGQYAEAIALTRAELDKFPNDFEGHMLLAGIHAEQLHDLPAAELIIQRLVEQPGHAPSSISYALSSMADWHLKYGQDPFSARGNFEKIIELLPNTEFALGAANRIAHLSTPEMLVAAHDRKIYAVPEGVKNLGLNPHQAPFAPAEVDAAAAAEAYVEHLTKHPLDNEAREKLAVLYADHYHRLDMAKDQLEQMIRLPNQPAKLVVHWLNLMADLQIRGGEDFDAARVTIQRIIDFAPAAGSAEIARNRLATLALEFRKLRPTGTVKLGQYEQNIGLRGNLPRPRHEL